MYHARYVIFGIILAAAMLIAVPVLRACPRCRVSAGEMADEALDAANQHGKATSQPTTGSDAVDEQNESSTTQPFSFEKGQFSIALGVDYTSAYFYRGYLQQDRGAIAQPYVSVSDVFGDDNNFSIQPYAMWWNSINQNRIDAPRGGHGRDYHIAHTVTTKSKVLVPGDPSDPTPHYVTETSETYIPANTGGGAGWYESELAGGALFTFRDFWIDLAYQIHFFPTDTHDAVSEINGKFSYDLAGFWDPTPPLNRKFSLRPYVLVGRELQDQNGDENTYIELGAEPTWRFKWLHHSFAVTTPVLLGCSPDGIYYDPNTDKNQFLGYTSEGIRGTMELPAPKGFGHWYLNASIVDLQLLAESTLHDNRGSHNEVIGTVGIAVMF